MHIDDFAKLIRVQVLNGPSPGPMERRNIEKYIKVQRPDIMPSTEIHTGWGFESSIDIHI